MDNSRKKTMISPYSVARILLFLGEIKMFYNTSDFFLMRLRSVPAGNGIQSELWRNVRVICNADVLVVMARGREGGYCVTRLG